MARSCGLDRAVSRSSLTSFFSRLKGAATGLHQSASSSCAGTRTINLIDGSGLVPSGMKQSGNEGKERRKERRVERELSGGGGATIHHPLPAAKTSTPELRLTHRLWLHEACHLLYVSKLGKLKLE
ncbi:hypothetical protein PIB30_086718 [Stylosanthes scabra]|uniref:Uncharacterized protein n=1 Tax=Stylosanthes scabra TaxID=79078 RepID=A0ABU6VTJ2_9FABA|nr:hypothetical protein [Stylosanthes scabra]